MDTHLHGQPLLWQRVEKKRRPGAAQPHCGLRAVCTMAWTPVLLVLLSHCAGSLSQPVLTQPPTLSASPGASARLTCTLSSGFSVGGYRIYWFQQKPGSPPRYLLSFYSDSNKHQGSGVPIRFSGSKDTSANAGLLLISGLQPEDEADYYCETWNNNAFHGDTHRWGSGTNTWPCSESCSMAI
nr:PREDICTED: immunoglobulin omega chain-like [Rhinolophus sinicus]